jgi:hypothetical protein
MKFSKNFWKTKEKKPSNQSNNSLTVLIAKNIFPVSGSLINPYFKLNCSAASSKGSTIMTKGPTKP